MKNKVCCCTGNRPKKFPFTYGLKSLQFDEYLLSLQNKIELAVTEHSVNHFISGMAAGVDLDFAELVINFRNTVYPDITLECAVPCPNQTVKWTNKDKLRYERVISNADTVTLVSKNYDRDCMYRRNRYMVDKSQMLIAVYNGVEQGGAWYTIKYARKKNLIVEIIKLGR